MKVPVSCPDCGWSTQVDDSHIGKNARCKSCGSVFRLEAKSGHLDSELPKAEIPRPIPSQVNEKIYQADVPTAQPMAPEGKQPFSEANLPSRIKELLFADESVKYASRPSVAALTIPMILFGSPCVLLMLMICGVGILAATGGEIGLFFMSMFFAGLLCVPLLWIYLDWKNQYYVITKDRTFAANGVLNVNIKFVSNKDVKNVSINTGFIDRWLDLNSVRITTVVGESVVLKYVKIGEVVQYYSEVIQR